MPYIGVHLNSFLQIQYLPDDDSDPPPPPHYLQRSCHRRGAEGVHHADDQGVEQEGCPGGGDPRRQPVERPPCQCQDRGGQGSGPVPWTSCHSLSC